jgi:hypothetical protein
MKKAVALIIALMLTLSLAGMLSFAAESSEEQPVADETTVRAYVYDQSIKHTPSIWLNTFDFDGTCNGSDYAIFKCATALKGIGLPEVYAGVSGNFSDATARFELFKWDENAEKTLTGTPVFSEEVYFDGDHQDLPNFTFESPLPAGQYLFRITQISDMDDEDHKPYIVLPISDLKYSETKIDFDSRGPFAFYIDCEKADGVEDYFLALEGKSVDIDIQPERSVIPRKANGGAFPFFEFGIVTPVVPDGQVLYSLALIGAPTWVNKNGDSDVSYEVFKWTGDYEESIDGKVLASGEIFDHADNSDLTIKFGTAMRYGNQYLIVLTRSNNGAIGYYEGEPDYPEGWEFYEVGMPVDSIPAIKVAYANVGDLGPEPTDAPTEAPTEAPPATDAPTDAPAVTDALAKTDAPAPTKDNGSNDNTGDKDNKGNKNKALPFIIIGASVLVIAGAVIAIVASKKKK